MEDRMASLEANVLMILTKMESLATKADLSEVKVTVAQTESKVMGRLLWMTIMVLGGIFAVLSAIVGLVAKASL